MTLNHWTGIFGRAAIGASLLLSAGSALASTATIKRAIEVDVPASQVWSLIGPFCAIKDWLPPVGQCIEDGKKPTTRVLVTKDGAAAFVELETARSEADRTYSYRFLSSPLPVSNYRSTINVADNGNGTSTITWTGSYTADAGKKQAADQALGQVYEAGLNEIRAKLGK